MIKRGLFKIMLHNFLDILIRKKSVHLNIDLNYLKHMYFQLRDWIFHPYTLWKSMSKSLVGYHLSPEMKTSKDANSSPTS